MGSSGRRSAAALALIVAATTLSFGISRADTFAITLAGPKLAWVDHDATFGGRLTGEGFALPIQDVYLMSGDEVIATTKTSIRSGGGVWLGAFTATAVFPEPGVHTVYAVAYRGTSLEVHSPEVTIDVLVNDLSGAAAIASGGFHACAIVAQGRVRCWGTDSSGQLGNGVGVDQPSATTVSDISGAIAIAAGIHHTCVLLSGGSVSCWGADDLGQLGDGPGESGPLPVTARVTGAIAISAGYNGACALVPGFGAYCWGVVAHFDDGNSVTYEYRSTPTDPGVAESVSIDNGGYHSCAVTTAARLRCWGENESGQVGDGSTVGRSYATAVNGFVGAPIEVTAGRAHSCAIDSAGGAQCWGDNSSFQIGDGSYFLLRLKPVPVASISGATDIDAGYAYTCALVARGEGRCWGANASGQLGDGTLTARRTSVAVSGLSDATSISAGSFHTCVLKNLGDVQCWGSNVYGQLGNGTFTNSSVPVNVPI